jgi:hypothetical protein
MIVTDSFVMLHFPRTGSTFVRSVLREMRLQWWDPHRLLGGSPPATRGFRELILPIDRTAHAERLGRRSQHGRWGQIPESHRHLPVVSVVRHPLDQAVSHFMHDLWRKQPPIDAATLQRQFPGWPNLSFSEFLGFQQEVARPDALKGIRPTADIGCTTVHFLRFYGRDPDALLAGATDARVDSGELARALPPIRWLRHHHLTDDLVEFLRDMGCPRRQLDRVRNHGHENVSAGRDRKPWQFFYTPEQERLARHRERLLFQMFSDLGR